MKLLVSRNGLKFVEDRIRDQKEDLLIADELSNLPDKTFDEMITRHHHSIAVPMNTPHMTKKSKNRKRKLTLSLDPAQRKKLFAGLSNLGIFSIPGKKGKKRKHGSRFKGLLNLTPLKHPTPGSLTRNHSLNAFKNLFKFDSDNSIEDMDTGSFKIFEESYKSFRSNNKFLNTKLDKIYKKAKTKKKMNRIEKKMANPHKMITTRTMSNNQKSRELVNIQTSINFFRTSMKPGMNYKEYNQEIREVQNLKKLKNEHRKAKTFYNLRLNHIKKTAELSRDINKKLENVPKIKRQANKIKRNFEELYVNVKQNYMRDVNHMVSKGVGSLALQSNLRGKKKRGFKGFEKGLGHRRFTDRFKGRVDSERLKLPGCFRSARSMPKQVSLEYNILEKFIQEDLKKRSSVVKRPTVVFKPRF